MLSNSNVENHLDDQTNFGDPVIQNGPKYWANNNKKNATYKLGTWIGYDTGKKLLTFGYDPFH